MKLLTRLSFFFCLGWRLIPSHLQVSLLCLKAHMSIVLFFSFLSGLGANSFRPLGLSGTKTFRPAVFKGISITSRKTAKSSVSLEGQRYFRTLVFQAFSGSFRLIIHYSVFHAPGEAFKSLLNHSRPKNLSVFVWVSEAQSEFFSLQWIFQSPVSLLVARDFFRLSGESIRPLVKGEDLSSLPNT